MYFMYQVSSISKLLMLLSFITNNFGGIEYTDVELKVGNLSFCLFFISFLQPKIAILPQHEISNNVVYATSKGSDQPAHTHSLIRAFASRSNILLVLSY